MDNRGYINPLTLPVNDDGFRCCRYCFKSILPPRRTFCSNDCVHEYRVRTSGTYLRHIIFQRDNGICKLCLIDTKTIADLIIRSDNQNKLREQYGISIKRKITPRKNGGGLWDADHIIPVKHGGGCCGIENIRTLCIKCHSNITFSK